MPLLESVCKLSDGSLTRSLPKSWKHPAFANSALHITVSGPNNKIIPLLSLEKKPREPIPIQRLADTNILNVRPTGSQVLTSHCLL